VHNCLKVAVTNRVGLRHLPFAIEDVDEGIDGGGRAGLETQSSTRRALGGRHRIGEQIRAYEGRRRDSVCPRRVSGYTHAQPAQLIDSVLSGLARSDLELPLVFNVSARRHRVGSFPGRCDDRHLLRLRVVSQREPSSSARAGAIPLLRYSTDRRCVCATGRDMHYGSA